jgi:hypothetical protein
VVISRRHWTEYIRDISEREEFLTAKIQIRNPNLLTRTKDIKAGTVTVTGNPVVWSGEARVVGYRSAVDSNKGNLSDPTGIKAIRFSIPHDSYTGRIERGWQIRVTEGGDSQRLTQYLFIIESDGVASNEASRIIQTSVDVEAVPGWG